MLHSLFDAEQEINGCWQSLQYIPCCTCCQITDLQSVLYRQYNHCCTLNAVHSLQYTQCCTLTPVHSLLYTLLTGQMLWGAVAENFVLMPAARSENDSTKLTRMR